MSVDLTWQAEVPVLDAAAATLTSGMSDVTGLRVDRNVIDGQPVSPMLLVASAGPTWPVPETMSGRQEIVVVRLTITAIGTSIDLATQLRAKAARTLFARDPAGGYAVPMTPAGLRVISRELTDRASPPPQMGGGWAQAILSASVLAQPQ